MVCVRDVWCRCCLGVCRYCDMCVRVKWCKVVMWCADVMVCV